MDEGTFRNHKQVVFAPVENARPASAVQSE